MLGQLRALAYGNTGQGIQTELGLMRLCPKPFQYLQMAHLVLLYFVPNDRIECSHPTVSRLQALKMGSCTHSASILDYMVKFQLFLEY